MKRLAGLVLLIALGIAGWFFGSQYFALYDLQQAASEGDVEAVAQRVDFPALRQSLTAELRDEIDERAARETGPLARLASGMANGAVKPVVDAVVTPRGVVRLVREGRVGPLVVRDTQRADQPVEWEIERDSLSRFVVRTDGGAGPTLIFRREGLGWKLSGVDL